MVLTPTGNQWNFDHDNRKKYKGEVPVPAEKTSTLMWKW
jgi:deoxyribodipyrimidine photolyase-related protein